MYCVMGCCFGGNSNVLCNELLFSVLGDNNVLCNGLLFGRKQQCIV